MGKCLVTPLNQQGQGPGPSQAGHFKRKCLPACPGNKGQAEIYYTAAPVAAPAGTSEEWLMTALPILLLDA